MLNCLEEWDENECRRSELFQMKSPADRAPGLDEIIGSEQEKTGVGDK